MYTTFGVGLWVAGVSPILLPYIMELKRPLEGSDGTLRPEDVVSPQRGEEDAEEAWNELWNAVEFVRLVMKSYSADSPQMKRAHWHLLPAIEQITLPGALEAVRMTTKDACKLGFGGFCYEGPGYFWRRPMPQWAVSEFTKVMAEGHSHKYSEAVTIAILESVATVITELKWGGGPLRPDGTVDPHAMVDLLNQSSSSENLGLWIQSDNEDDVLWFTKHRAKPRRAQHLIRITDFIRLLRGKHLIVTYINTKLNLLADLISRSYRVNESVEVVPDEKVFAEFLVECAKAGYPNPVEIHISDDEMEAVLPEQFHASAEAHWKMMQGSVLAKKTPCSETKGNAADATLAAGSVAPLEQRRSDEVQFTGTFGFHGLGGGIRGARGRFHLTQGYDIEPAAQKSVQKWAPQLKQLGDIQKVDVRTIIPTDMAHMGPPCQGVSIIGSLKGLLDKRMNLYLESALLITAVGFKVIVVEMVRNILDFYDGIIQEGFIQILERKGFECSMSVDTAYRHHWRPTMEAPSIHHDH